MRETEVDAYREEEGARSEYGEWLRSRRDGYRYGEGCEQYQVVGNKEMEKDMNSTRGRGARNVTSNQTRN